MSGSVRLTKAELAAPPMAQKIQQRSFLVGAIFAILGLLGAFVQPDEFFRAYLLGFMDWLGISLGAMALLMRKSPDARQS